MNGALSGIFFGTAPWGPEGGSKGQILFNFNYRVNFKDFYTKFYKTTAKRGNFLSQKEVYGIYGIKTPYNHVKTEIPASKSCFHSFSAVLWSMDHSQKLSFQCI